MRPAALLLILAPALACAAERAGPAVTRIGSVDYINIEDEAARIGLRVERLGAQAILLKDGARPVAQLTEHSREMDLKGLRVFLGNPVNEKGGAFHVSLADYRLRLLPRLRPALCPPPPQPPRKIAIDPGHGGHDHGAENHALGTMEKTYTLDVASRMKRMLEAAGYEVVMTRDSDVDVPLALRAEVANRAGADLFVSIHFNSLYPNTKTTGAEVLNFPPPRQRSTDSWRMDGRDDAEPAAAPVNAFDAWNTLLAGAVHLRILDALRDGDRGEKFAHLGVLRELKCPGILVESAIISSDKESALLETSAFREKIASAVCAGIGDYAEQLRALRPEAPRAQPGPAPAAAPGAAAQRFEPTRPNGT
jgi:N-acetylmuramoyl-L-alanine amidase